MAICLWRPTDGLSLGKEPESAELRLGKRLFEENDFSSRAGDREMSCRSCHMLDDDPQGFRVYNDIISLSWAPWRAEDGLRTSLRNTPTLIDSDLMPRLHMDGEFGSLEELVVETFTGRNYGWLSDEREQALDQIAQVIRDDPGAGGAAQSSYPSQFEAAYGFNVAHANPEEISDLVSRSVSQYIRTFKTARTSAYDLWVSENQLPSGPAEDQSAVEFAADFLGRIERLESQGRLQLGPAFGPAALDGLKIFLRTDGEASAGNCVTCHMPPAFTDFRFHNLGISQLHYDRLHGEGSFARLEVPGAATAARPVKKLGRPPSRREPEFADLGYWNFVDLGESAAQTPDAGRETILRSALGAFKTPTLRNLVYSQPYMHNGEYPNLRGALATKIEAAQLAGRDLLREGSAALGAMKIDAEDLGPLVAFLRSLTETLYE